MTKIKGFYAYHLKNFYIEKYGIDKFKEVVNNMDKSLQMPFLNDIDDGKWFDSNAYQCFQEVMSYTTGKESIAEFAKSLAEKSMKGFLGLFMHFVSMEKVMKTAERGWSKSFDEGQLKVTEVTEKIISFKIIGYPIKYDAMRISLGYFFAAIADHVLKKNGTHEMVQRGPDEIDFTYWIPE